VEAKWDRRVCDHPDATNNLRQLTAHLHDFINAYNYGRRLKTPRSLTPYAYICKCWTIEPGCFNLHLHQRLPGPNS